MAAPNLDFKSLWTCPVCSVTHEIPVEFCRRCECQILLLNKIRIVEFLREQHKMQFSDPPTLNS